MNNIIFHKMKINKEKRRRLYGHSSVILWFTGLSGSGKSTIADKVEEFLFDKKIRTYLLDGDNIRKGLNNDLTFSFEDREENIRRIGEVAKLFIDSGIITLISFISPYKKDRDKIRNNVEIGEFIEIYVKCSIEECERRDVKGLYKKARKGEIKDFTGINSPYEIPENPEIIVDTEKSTIDQCISQIIKYLESNKII